MANIYIACYGYDSMYSATFIHLILTHNPEVDIIIAPFYIEEENEA